MTADVTELNPKHVDRFCQIVTDTTGILLPERKRHLIQGRLRKRLGALGLPDVAAYLHLLFEEGKLDEELQTIVDLMATNRTEFFREAAHTDFLAEHILPEQRATMSRFKLWSAASSFGHEAYSCAMVLAEHSRNVPGFRFGVLGTDISERVIEIAQSARYSNSDLALVPEALRGRYVRPVDDSFSEIIPQITRLVRFGQINLIDAAYPIDRDIDVIFLRNVLIYFDAPTRDKVISAVAGHLRPGGHLIVGHAESMTVSHPALTARAVGIFQKDRKE